MDKCIVELQNLATTILVKTRNYFTSLNLALNLDKTVMMRFGNSQEKPQNQISNMTLGISDVTRFLGMDIDKNLNDEEQRSDTLSLHTGQHGKIGKKLGCSQWPGMGLQVCRNGTWHFKDLEELVNLSPPSQ